MTLHTEFPHLLVNCYFAEKGDHKLFNCYYDAQKGGS